ncbi:MAG: glutamate--tRNA ligase family protein [Actinomycetota bacterium]|nr:glutamate--tRNA ligase family protein [Actinomycetota bacterium]
MSDDDVPSPPGALRVRFAPSPTGYLHVGSARTALFNWVVARQHGGTFVLRIEDTDAERNREEWVTGILTAMHWLGLDPDEGPYRQSDRVERHGLAVDLLWSAGLLYACGCSRDEIEERNRAAGETTPGYDGFCRSLGLDRGDGRALRFRTPGEGATVVADVIRGNVRFPHSAMEDFVVVKSSGAPLFVLANVVDDIDMGITHVIRGEDLLPTTPKGVLLWEALAAAGWEPEGAARPVHAAAASGGGPVGAPAVIPTAGLASVAATGPVPGPQRGSGPPGPGGSGRIPLPVFAHLPMLVNEKRQKLSKRRDPVAVESYREQGYLPEAFVNYLALLGWSPPGDREVFGVDELVASFRLEHVNHAPAFFDVKKLTHVNGEHIRAMSTEDFVAACRPWLTGPRAPWPPDRFDDAVFVRMAPLVQERISVLAEVVGMVDFLFLEEPAMDEVAWAKAVAPAGPGPAILRRALEVYGTIEEHAWQAGTLQEAMGEVAADAGLKVGKAQAPVRVALTGRSVGPPLFESMEALGSARVLARLRAALARATANTALP